MVVVTEVFANLAQTAARARGYNHLAALVLPHPMETRSVEEIRRIASDRSNELLSLLTSAPSPSGRGNPSASGVEFASGANRARNVAL